MDYSDEVPYTPTYRSLSEPVYRLRWYFIRLTDGDLAVTTLSTVVLMIASDVLGIEQYKIGAFSLDPFGYLELGLALTLLISLGHKLRPEGDIELIVRGLFSTKILTNYTQIGDRFWLSSIGKITRQFTKKNNKFK